jgi:hypothetical protein
MRDQIQVENYITMNFTIFTLHQMIWVDLVKDDEVGGVRSIRRCEVTCIKSDLRNLKGGATIDI